MAINCGNCKEQHELAREVKACYGFSGRFDTAIELPEVDPAEDEMAAEELAAERAATVAAETDDRYAAEADLESARAAAVDVDPAVEGRCNRMAGRNRCYMDVPCIIHGATPEVPARNSDPGMEAYDRARVANGRPSVRTTPTERNTERELVAWLREQTWSGFAQSLTAGYDKFGRLTPKQRAAAERMRAKTLKDNVETHRANETKTPDVPAGRYAVENSEGALAFYSVDRPTEGRWAGYTFLSVQASDDLHPIRDRSTKIAILNKIAADPHAASLRYGRELGRCGVCNRTLTDSESRAKGIGPVCEQRAGW